MSKVQRLQQLEAKVINKTATPEEQQEYRELSEELQPSKVLEVLERFAPLPASMADLLAFVKPVVAEFVAEVPTGWSVTAAQTESYVRFMRDGKPGQIEFAATVPDSLRWWVASADTYGATLAEAVGKARAQGWKL